MNDSPASAPFNAPTWWTDPTTFRERLTAFNKDAKVAGDTGLPESVRVYLAEIEQCQNHELSGVPARKSPPTVG